MRRWLGQASGGEERKEAGDEDIDRACETKKRKFNAEWLVFDDENVVMFCRDCRMYAKEHPPPPKRTVSWWELIILKSRQ